MSTHESPTVYAVVGDSDGPDTAEDLQQLTAEAAERWKITQALATSTPWCDTGCCHWCGAPDDGSHVAKCLWLRARKLAARAGEGA